jgi:transcriptional regulator
MVVSSFTVPELNYLRDNCNFVGTESDVFEMRSKGIPLEEIAEILNMSAEGIRKVSRKVNNKITRVL